MLLLWLMLLVGVCDVAHCMEGPRGKVTREMCSKPASQVPEEHWPYCCEGYGKLCEDFAASCYVDCQPVVSSGHDVTLVEERPGFCCALYNFCCAREFSRIGDLQKVEIEERFPIFHRFHGPGRIAPRGPSPRKNKAKQDINNDVSEISNTVNRIGRARQPSRNNEPRVQADRFDSNSAKSLEVEVSRSGPQQKRSNQKLNVAKPQRSSARFPTRPQNVKSKENNRPTSPRLPASNFGQLKANNEHSIQSEDSFGKITPNKKIETQAKTTNNVEERKNINENSQQLNEEAENRKTTLNRAGVTSIKKESKTNPSTEVDNNENQENLTPTKQIKRVSIPRIIKRQPEITNEQNSKDKQEKEEETTSKTTEEPITARPSNGRKVKLGKIVLVRTAPKTISNNEQEVLKSIDSVQNKQVIKPIASRRTLISNKQTSPKNIINNDEEVQISIDSIKIDQDVKPIVNRRTVIRNRQTGSRIAHRKISQNEPEILKSIDSVQNSQEVKPTSSRRTLISNRQTNTNKINNNEQEVIKSIDSAQTNQEVKPTASRRTLIRNRQTSSRTAPKKIDNNEPEILKSTDSVQFNKESKPHESIRTVISNRQTGPRRSSPTVPNTKESSTTETKPEESNVSRGTDRNNGRRIKQTVRRISSDKTTQNESVRRLTSTIKVPQKVETVKRISTRNKPVINKSVVLASDLEKQNVKSKVPENSKLNITSNVLRNPFNTTESTTMTPLKKEANAPILDLDTSETQISENKKVQTILKFSKEEKDKPKDESETESLQQAINENIQKIVRELTEQNLKQLESRKGNKVNENQQENRNSSSIINRPSIRQGRTRIRVTAPTAVESRDAAVAVTGGNSAITNTSTRRRSSRTRHQESTLQKETPISTSTNRGTSRSGRAELFGRKDVSKTPVQNVANNSENSARRTTGKRGRQSA